MEYTQSLWFFQSWFQLGLHRRNSVHGKRLHAKILIVHLVYCNANSKYYVIGKIGWKNTIQLSWHVLTWWWKIVSTAKEIPLKTSVECFIWMMNMTMNTIMMKMEFLANCVNISSVDDDTNSQQQCCWTHPFYWSRSVAAISDYCMYREANNMSTTML